MSANEWHLQEQVPLAAWTTIGLGGPARYFASCASVEALRTALAWARARGLRVHVLGGGSNTVFADEGFDGLVVHVALRGLSFAEEGDAVRVSAAGGEPWDAVVTASVARGLSGIEALAGIPGSAGATPVQNVGAYGQEVAQTLVSLRALDRLSGEEVTLPASACGFGYRRSRFKLADRERYIITEVSLRLQPRETVEVRYAELARALAERGLRPTPAAVRETVLALRRAKSMVVDPTHEHTRSCGSFFTNPVVTPEHYEALRAAYPDLPAYPSADGVKLVAAWLIERAGFARGTRRGGVGLSPHHALALVNYGGNSAELRAFAAEIQAAVQARFGVWLEIEPVMVAP